jgi:hypothetical protein
MESRLQASDLKLLLTDLAMISKFDMIFDIMNEFIS